MSRIDHCSIYGLMGILYFRTPKLQNNGTAFVQLTVMTSFLVYVSHDPVDGYCVVHSGKGQQCGANKRQCQYNGTNYLLWL